MINVTEAEVYQAALRRRERSERAAQAALRERAMAAARAAAEMLRREFDSSRVLLFGSLVEEKGAWFGSRSDIDLAVWGVAAADYFAAVARLNAFSSEFDVDVVAMERCPPHLFASIERYGIPI